MEPLNKGHLGTALFVLCKEVVLFGRLNVLKLLGLRIYFGTSSLVLRRVVYCTVSLFGRVHYQRFLCTPCVGIMSKSKINGRIEIFTC